MTHYESIKRATEYLKRKEEERQRIYALKIRRAVTIIIILIILIIILRG